jgi:V/A-type H+-transporting ATPase subunit F
VQFRCIADEDTVRGFRLAGVPGRAVADAPAASAALAEACAEPDCGIVIVSSPVAALLRAEIEALRLGRDRPLIVEIPGPAGASSQRRSLRDIVQEAMGIRIETEIVP